MLKNSKTENDGIHIDKIIGSVSCGRHAADIGDACWNVPSVYGPLKAICNRRALAAGADGFVTPYEPKSHTSTIKKDFKR